jgi:predicted unusual protein kinase regulating ubiquinone biosynthesis (AarF/ABC1/UbiB family)
MLIGRSLEGLGLLAWLGTQYVLAMWLGRLWRRPARAWRGWLDRHGAGLVAGYARRRGAMLIKIGQFIASRPDVFPLTYVDACAELRDQADPRPWPMIAAALDAQYEGRIASHLARIEETALAAASFGQVHRAWLVDGSPVAVKVQYPDLGPLVARDLALVRLALRLFAIALPGWPLDQIYAEIARTAREEQDYLHEGGAADRVREALAAAGLSVPRVHWEHTREKVLVTEFVAGDTLARLSVSSLDPADRRRIADALIDGFLAMLLDLGFFHADPHAGNIMIERLGDGGARVWLIDFGMTAAISRRESGLYRRFLACLREHDTDGMVDVLVQLGFVLPNADRSQLRILAREVYDSLGHLDPRSFKGSRRQADLAAKIGEFLRRMDGIVFPQHTLLLFRATSLIEGDCMELVPGVNILDLVRPRLRAIGWATQARRLLDEIKETWTALRALPDRIDAAVARRDARGGGALAVVAAVLLAGALQLQPSGARTIAAACAGIGVLIGLRRAR